MMPVVKSRLNLLNNMDIIEFGAWLYIAGREKSNNILQNAVHSAKYRVFSRLH